MSVHPLRPLALGLLALAGASCGAQQLLQSKVNADDQFKLFLSDDLNQAGVQFSQGLGWGATYSGTALPPSVAPGSTFYLNIWVGDIGGAVGGLLGEFKLVGGGSCVFANGATTLRTVPNKLWRVTKPLPASVSLPTPAGYPATSWWNNDLPRYLTPTLVPASAQVNGAGAPSWPVMPAINPAAHWIYTPGLPLPSPGDEVWFQTMIRC